MKDSNEPFLDSHPCYRSTFEALRINNAILIRRFCREAASDNILPKGCWEERMWEGKRWRRKNDGGGGEKKMGRKWVVKWWNCDRNGRLEELECSD